MFSGVILHLHSIGNTDNHIYLLLAKLFRQCLAVGVGDFFDSAGYNGVKTVSDLSAYLQVLSAF